MLVNTTLLYLTCVVAVLAPAHKPHHAVRYQHVGTFTAYTSRCCETSKHPYLTADQTDLKKSHVRVIANNHLPLGSIIEIEDLGCFTVKDHMKRGTCGDKFDIYFGDNLTLARRFGVKHLRYKIIRRKACERQLSRSTT